MARAQWTFGQRTQNVNGDGSATVILSLLDKGVKQGDVFFTMTADRALRVEFQIAPGVPPLTDFQAWIREDGS
jgi:hypothetical protein